METNMSFKVILLGDTGVGKTSILLRKMDNSFSFQMAPTVGASHLKSVIQIDGKNSVELKIWDTAGQEQFASLVPMYARNTDVCIIVASITDPASIEHIETWKDRLFAAGEKPPIFYAINKIDLDYPDGNSGGEVQKLKDQLSQQYQNLFFVSAKTGEEIEALFNSVAVEVYTQDACANQIKKVNEPEQNTEKQCNC